METLAIITLRKLCKIRKIKNFSKLSKTKLVGLITSINSTTKIQKWYRNLKQQTCSISMEPLKYPCFPFVPRKGVIIYYNLNALVTYLVKTGDFRDPTTREPYTEKQLKQIDEISKNNHSRNKDSAAVLSVYKASKNIKFYKRIKEKETEQLILERELDGIVDKILTDLIDDKNQLNRVFLLSSLYLPTYKLHYRRLYIRNIEHAQYAIKKNIEGLEILIKKNNYIDKQLDDLLYVIYWLYDLKFDNSED
jgi:hypothetical protein